MESNLLGIFFDKENMEAVDAICKDLEAQKRIKSWKKYMDGDFPHYQIVFMLPYDVFLFGVLCHKFYKIR
jgi:hypothetical protein